MGQIFDLCFLILSAFFLEKIVVAFDGDAELSSAPHIRQTRMDHQPGTSSSSSSSHDLTTSLKELRKVNMKKPTPVEIIFGESSYPGYAIHPYFVITRRDYVLEGFHVFAHSISSGLLEMQNVRRCKGDVWKEVVLIQLTNPIMLNNPVRHAFSSENYRNRATNWAKGQVQNWIDYYEPRLKEPPAEPLTEFRHYDPTKVVMTHNGTHLGPGFAMHPHIVVTRRNYIQSPVGVLSYTATRGQFKTHRVENIYMHEDVGVVRLHDPILLNFPVPDAYKTHEIPFSGLVFADTKVQDWIREFYLERNRMHHV